MMMVGGDAGSLVSSPAGHLKQGPSTMKSIHITRDILVAGEHTEAGTMLAVGTEIDAETASRLVREQAAVDPDTLKKAAKPAAAKAAA